MCGGGSRKKVTGFLIFLEKHKRYQNGTRAASMERTALEKGFAKSMGIYFQDSL
jgi:hypothetical protein